MSAFQAYEKYLALKQHFTRDAYDYFKYNGRVNTSSSKFEQRKDKYLFYKLSKKKDLEGFLLANFLDNDAGWVRDVLSLEADTIYNDWLKRKQSLMYVFESDCTKLDDNININLTVKNGDHPLLLKLFLRKEISIETLIIMDITLNVFEYWNKKIRDDILWPEVYRKCIKYKPFLSINLKKCKEILKNRFMD
jgi:hypothetical protein